MEFVWWLTLSVTVLPVTAWLIWWWNELRYVRPVEARIRKSGKKLPPGNMGLPFLGELLTFLWYFKVLRRPDDFINSKRQRYGDGVGMYRTHLFGNPSIITCSPATNKFILQSDDAFPYRWPTNNLVGPKSLISAPPHEHAKLKKFVTTAIDQPKALHKIALLIQPRIIAALRSWANREDITAVDEVKKMTCEYVGKLFASIEPGPSLDEVFCLFNGLMRGFRAQPFDIPGTAYHHALQCRKKLVKIFRAELERRKRSQNEWSDLMEELMQIEDEDGNRLSDDEVVDNIVSLVIGGYEPISTATTWAFYYLASCPDVLHKLREENVAFSKNKVGELITSEDVTKMKYTSKVVEEILRMANVAAFVFRLGDRDVEYQGYVIPKGWKVIVWLRYGLTDLRNFENPLCFNPDRWNKPAKRESFQIFGGGSRICAANMFARMQIALFLHHLCVGYKWELKNPDIKTNYLPLPRPSDGMKIVLRRI